MTAATAFLKRQVIQPFMLARLLARAFGRYKREFGVLTALGFLGGLFEAIGINAFIPLVSFFLGEDVVRSPDFITQTLERLFSFVGVEFSLISLLVFIPLLFVFKAVTTLVFDIVRIRIITEYERETRDQLFRMTLAANWPYLRAQQLGHLETLLKVDVHKSARILQDLTKFIMMTTGLAMYLVVAVNISQTITIASMVVGLLVFFAFKPLLTRARRYASKMATMNRDVARHINENIVGMKVIKALHAEESVGGIGSTFFEQFRQLSIKAFITRRAAVVFIQPIAAIFVAVVVGFAFFQTSYNPGALAAIIYLIQRVFAHVQNSQKIMHTINDAVPYLQNVLRYENQVNGAIEQKDERGTESFRFKRELAFKNVSFFYEDAAKPILDNLSFSIKRGGLVGLIGSSGSGKTTTFELLLRFFLPQSGKITVDGEEIHAIKLDEWRRNVVYVPQDVFLLNDTIAENIRFKDGTITDEEIKAAARKANIYDEIKALPKGFDTMAGERGTLLSTGQRQRIALARALARKPAILLLDEATSALDNESEQRIKETIQSLKGEMTVVAIAHRLSTVLDADDLLVLEDGKIIEHGNPKTLLKDKETYFARMYNLRG